MVLTRDAAWQAEGAEVAHDPDRALALAGADAAVIGGAETIALFEPHATRWELTAIAGAYHGDTVLAAPGPQWREVARDDHAAQDGRPAFAWISYERAARDAV